MMVSKIVEVSIQDRAASEKAKRKAKRVCANLRAVINGLGMNQGAVIVMSMQTRQQNCAATAKLRPESMQVVYAQAANHPAQENGRRFGAQIVAFGNLLGGLAGA